MEQDSGESTEPLTYGCMECKAQHPYTVHQWPNGNTTWHCTVCGKISRLIPGKYTEHAAPSTGEVSA